MQKLALVLHAACMTLNAGEKRPSYPVEAVLHVFFFLIVILLLLLGAYDTAVLHTSSQISQLIGVSQCSCLLFIVIV